MPAEYSPVRQDDGHEDDSPVNAKFHAESIKPVTYYDEGEFDPPSSDDEEETFLEKSLSRKSPGDAERLGDGGVEDDGELVVGGQVLCKITPVTQPRLC